MTKIVATSDFHGYLPEIPECDILLVGGDVCPVYNHDRKFQAAWLRSYFKRWLKEVPAKHIVGIGGNHDFVIQDSYKFKKELPWHLLYSETVEIEGLKIWGSPYSPSFGNWAFMRSDKSLAEEWEKIPSDTDILLVHGPMYGYGDAVIRYSFRPTASGVVREKLMGEHVGSSTLRNRLAYGEFNSLKLFVFGHIHEGYGTGSVDDLGFIWANVSHVNEEYNNVNPPMVFEL